MADGDIGNAVILFDSVTVTFLGENNLDVDGFVGKPETTLHATGGTEPRANDRLSVLTSFRIAGELHGANAYTDGGKLWTMSRKKFGTSGATLTLTGLWDDMYPGGPWNVQFDGTPSYKSTAFRPGRKAIFAEIQVRVVA